MRGSFVCLVLLVSACSGGGGGGEFSPLIQPGSAGRYDLTLEGVDTIREATLAPGAAPARPVIEGDRATRKGRFLTTHSCEVDPVEIGERMLAALEAAPFLESVEVTRGGEGFSADIVYRAKSSVGDLRIVLAATDDPNRVELTYEVEERLR